MRVSENFPIYLDYAATAPVDPVVMKKMLPWFTEQYGNASSRFHPYGWLAEEAVEEARKVIATISGFSEKEVIFTSGATESVNLGLIGFFETLNFEGGLITCSTEHKATLDTTEYLAQKGVNAAFLSVDDRGRIDLDDLAAKLRSNARLVSLMQVNNETGVIHDIQQIYTLCKEAGAKLHVDATQGVGKLPFPEADLLSFSAHKIYGPKGMGCLLAKKDLVLSPQVHGGKHQRNRRSGTLNVPGIVGLAEALKLAEDKRIEESERLRILTRKLETGISSVLNFVKINGIAANRAPGFSNMCFKGLDGEELLMRMNKIAVSNGSACNSASTEPSYVLQAMGLSEAEAYSSIRFSLGRFTTEGEIEEAIEHVIETVKSI